MRTHKSVMLAAVSMAGIVAVAGVVLAQPHAERTDGPEKITCPQAGEIICRDKCPTVNPNRADCPGRIVCPLTGKLVCQDRCPLREFSTSGAISSDRYTATSSSGSNR